MFSPLGLLFLKDNVLQNIQEDHLAVWHRTASDTVAAGRVRDALRRILQLPTTMPIEYKVHSDCLRASTARAPDSATTENGEPST